MIFKKVEEWERFLSPIKEYQTTLKFMAIHQISLDSSLALDPPNWANYYKFEFSTA